MVLPRGFKYTMNQIVQNMIMAVVEASGVYEYALPHAWSEMHCPGIRNMFTTIDRIRAKGYKYWFVLKQNSFLARIPHDRLVQKIQIMFQDERVADVVCALMGLNVPEADEHNKSMHFGIPKYLFLLCSSASGTCSPIRAQTTSATLPSWNMIWIFSTRRS